MRNGIGNLCGKLFLCLPLLFLFVPVMRAQGDAEANYKKCAGCHGPDGSGNTPAGKAMGVRDFKSAEVQKETDAELAAIISNGKGKMPKYADKLKDTEIKDLVVYIRGLGKTK
jgi:mono/diheme cytochrome c family protein